MGQFGPASVGATYTSKMSMDKFDKYKGLFAEDGGFDMPEHYTVGVAFRPAGGWLVGMDYKKIKYSSIASIGNPSTNQAPLGSANGPGFGWQDVDVWKFGAQYQATPELQVRAGYGKTDNPILSRDVTFNILAPGVVKDQWSLGLTWKLDRVSEITGAAMYAQNNSVTGQSLFVGFGAPPTTSETIQMKEYLLGIAYSRKF